ncbi:MAG: hypothetical protein RL748_2664 [Pseudomonadota bacterium]|jgi:hypothetical protein
MIKIELDLSQDEASAFAQFLKRVYLSHYRPLAKNDDEAYEMMAASEKLRAAFAQEGIAPR